MNSRERVFRALNRQPIDRIPIDIGGMHNLTTMHKNAYVKLREYLKQEETPITISSMLSQSAKIDEYVRQRFHADCYPIYTTGPDKYMENLKVSEDGYAEEYTDEFGVVWRKPLDGLYFDPHIAPLQNMTLEEIKNYSWPDPNTREYVDQIKDEAKHVYENTDYAIILGGPFNGGVFVPVQWLMGHVEFFMAMILDTEKLEYLLDKVVEYHIGQWGLMLDEIGDYATACVLSDDLGGQEAPLFDPNQYRALIKPRMKKVIDFIKSKKPDMKIIYHCDGAIKDFFPDFIDLGIDAWNPIQISAAGMDDTGKIFEEVGDKVSFWGGCADAHTLVNGTKEDIYKEVRRRMNDLAPGNGLIAGSIHNIQQDVPVENIVSFYDSLYEIGKDFYKK